MKRVTIVLPCYNEEVSLRLSTITRLVVLLGMIGEYLGRILNVTKRRPIYLVAEKSVRGSHRYQFQFKA